MNPTTRGSNSASPWSRSGLLALVVLLVSMASPARADDSSELSSAPPDGLRPTLDAAEFTSLRSRLAELDFSALSDALADGRGTAASCRVGPDASRCCGVDLTLTAMRLSTEHIAFDSGTVRLKQTTFVPADSPRNYQFDTLVLENGELQIEGLRLQGEADAVMTAAFGRIGDGWLNLGPVTWTGPADSEPVMRAEHLHWTGKRWQFERIRRETRPVVGLGHYETDRARPTTGLVPPRVIYGADRFEWIQRAVHGPTLLGLSASVAAPEGWYGFGPVIQTPPDKNPFAALGPRPALLDGQVRWTPGTREVGWSVTGRFRRGDEYTHVGGYLEEQSATEFWRTARVDAPGVLRNWRASRAGFSLSGAGHHLQLRAGRWSRAPVDETSTARLDRILPGDQFDLGLEFAAVHDLDDSLEATTALFHHNAMVEGGTDTHRTVAIGDLTGRVGSRSRVYAELGATAMLGSELGPPSGDSRGFDARGTSQLVAHARAGLTLSGRWGEKLVHRLAPRLAAYREVTSFGTTDVGDGGPDGRWSRPVAPTPGWTALAGILGQTVEWTGGRVHFPFGVLAHGAANGSVIDQTHAFGRLRLEAGRYALSSGVRHRIGRDALTWSGGAGFHGSDIDVVWRLTTDAAGDRALGRIDRIVADPVDAVRLLQPYADLGARIARSERLFQTLSLGGDVGEVRADVGLFSEGGLAEHGVTLGLAHGFDPLGWGLAVDGVYAFESERWGVSAGLTTTAARRRGR